MTLAPSYDARGRAGGPELSTRRRWAGLAVLSASLLVVVMDMTILNVALPDLVADLRPGAVAQLWIVDVYPLVLAGLLVPVAAVADRVGRRRVLLLGFAVFGGGSLLVLLADSAGAVIGLRALLGVGGAMIMPATLSLIRALFPDGRERALALSVWAATAAAGGAVGPVIGGALMELAGWHAAFLVNVPLMVVAVVAGALLLPESRSAHPGRLDAIGVLTSVVGAVALVHAVKHGARHGVDLETLVAVVVGVVLLRWFVRRCLRQDDPMLAVRLFADPVFRAGVVAALASSTVMVALLLVGSQWLQLVEGFSPLQAGAALVPLAISSVVAAPLAPGLAARHGVRTVLVGGLLTASSGLLLLGLLPRPLDYPAVAVALGVVGLGTSALGLGSALIMGRAPEHQAGSAAATEEMSYEIGAVLGVSLLGGLAGVVYRGGLPADAPEAVRESVAGALGTSLADTAGAAWTTAFGVIGLVGCAAVALAAAVVWRWIPRDLDLGALEH
ncbi:MAG: MFS transporter [Nocardioides sp.]|nr:MFS transporter [Nocardioides sp.]